jgi:hypothetical protein
VSAAGCQVKYSLEESIDQRIAVGAVPTSFGPRMMLSTVSGKPARCPASVQPAATMNANAMKGTRRMVQGSVV